MKKRSDSEALLKQTQDTYDWYSSAFSNNDCTGLVPTGLNENEKAERYKEMYSMNPSKMPR